MEVSVPLTSGSEDDGRGVEGGQEEVTSDLSKFNCCLRLTKNYFLNRLPILKWFPQYEWRRDLVPDSVAGLSVGLTAIPQSMAYARIAGLTPEYGLYSSFVSCFLYIFLGSCRQMTIGPTAVVELLTFETCGHDFPACVVLTGFYVGVIQLCMGILQLGTIVSLISEPVTIGFVAGAALTISSSQIKSFLGLEGPKGNGFLGYWKAIIFNISSLKIGDTLMGLIALVALFLFKNLKDWLKGAEGPLGRVLWFLSISRNALIVIVTSIVAYSWPEPPFALTGRVKSGFPPFGPPQFLLPLNSSTTSMSFLLETGPPQTLTFWQSLGELGTGPLTVAFISILQNVAIAKGFGSGQSIDANQEMIGLGISHLTASFFSAMPTSGSFSRSAINEASGVRSPISGLFTGVLVIFALGFLTPSFYYIPKASLASVILSAVLPMIEYQSLVPMWRVSKRDFMAAAVTFFGSLLLGMEYGILIGVATSLAFYLIGPLRPQIQSRVVPFDEEISVGTGYLLIKPDQGFSFPSVDYIRNYINHAILKNSGCSVVVLDCGNMTALDFTAATALASLAKGVGKTGKKLVFLNCKTDWPAVFSSIGFGDPQCFNSAHDLVDLQTDPTNSTNSSQNAEQGESK